MSKFLYGPSGPVISRRQLLKGTAAIAGAAVASSVLPASLRRAAAKTIANPTRSSLNDIKHIAILMQENRSFDHYFGTFPGVRGFNDPTAIALPGGNPVFYQPDPSHANGYLLPFHYDTKTTSAQATPGTDLANTARGVGRRENGRLGGGKGPVHYGLFHGGRHPLPARTGASVHAL